MAAQDLIPVFTGPIQDQPQLLCDARALHAYLQVGRRFASWIAERIDEYGFVENQDFVIASRNGEAKKAISRNGEIDKRGGHNRVDYYLTLDMAKELAMVERNEQGRAVRRYFIECERQLQQQARLKLCDADVVNLHAAFCHIKQLREFWRQASPALRALESPLAGRYHDHFADLHLASSLLRDVATQCADFTTQRQARLAMEQSGKDRR